MKPITKYTLRIPVFLIASILFLVTGCSKDELEYVHELDKNVFFTIRIDTKEYTSYGYYNKTSPMIHGGPTLTQVYKKDSAGNNIKEITVGVTDKLMDQAGNVYGIPGGIYVDLGNCELNMKMRKTGEDLVGEYHSLAGDVWENKINESAMDADRYSIDTSGLSFIIAQEAKHPSNYFKIITGSFSCKVFHYSNPTKLIQASGTFKMYSN